MFLLGNWWRESETLSFKQDAKGPKLWSPLSMISTISTTNFWPTLPTACLLPVSESSWSNSNKNRLHNCIAIHSIPSVNCAYVLLEYVQYVGTNIFSITLSFHSNNLTEEYILKSWIWYQRITRNLSAKFPSIYNMKCNFLVTHGKSKTFF